MIEFLMILTFLCAIVYFYWQMKHALHMFQQNRYELPRYLYWMKTQWKTEKKACINLFIKESLLVGIFIITRAFSLNSRLLVAFSSSRFRFKISFVFSGIAPLPFCFCKNALLSSVRITKLLLLLST